jgi:hypothetical protein
MPAETVPYIVAVCAAFSLFILVVGGVAVWTNLPDRTERD